MEIRLNNVNGEYNLHLETEEQEHVALSTWGYKAGGHYVDVTFYNVKRGEVMRAFLEAFADEPAELIQDALTHFANHCPFCNQELEFSCTSEEAREWLGKELAAETVRRKV